MSSSHTVDDAALHADNQNTADHPDELPCEPDDVPVRFLTIISAVVTAVVIALVVIAVWAFNSTTAAELQAKGYTVEGPVPMDGAPAETAAPAEGAHE